MAPHIERASSNRFMVQESNRSVSQVYIRMVMRPVTMCRTGPPPLSFLIIADSISLSGSLSALPPMEYIPNKLSRSGSQSPVLSLARGGGPDLGRGTMACGLTTIMG